MAAPIVPVLKKLGMAILTDKKASEKVIEIVLILIVFIITPILAVVGFCSELTRRGEDMMERIISEYEERINTVCEKIEEEMKTQGFTDLQIEEAQTLYAFALCDFGEQEDFLEKLLYCYRLKEQTDEELIQKINEVFGTNYLAEEYTSLMQEIRDRYVLDEDKNQG